MFISPMLLESTKDPFDDDSYITELKFDGIRLVLSKFNNQIKLYTRHKNEVSSKFPELLNLDVPGGTVLDGEVIVTDADGSPDFEAVMERFMSNKSPHKIVYCIFDVIYSNGQSIASKPLTQRKEALKALGINHPNAFVLEGIKGNGVSYFSMVKEKGLEGIVLKKANSSYEIGRRSKNWIKVINYDFTEVLITGYSRKDIKFLLTYQDGTPAGMMEFMPKPERHKFHLMKKLTSETEDFVFIEPIHCKVKHRFRTKHGKLRLPSFVSWRE
ncbi:ATP-dependent DNA ligase [Bacillus subtilis]|uniref:ATP-dependent DNA ligase n=1 Tax=Bacillus subtilis TaxID=1423 RepID=UPI002DBE3064|nr:ATP-dependent DNA ligase [Bacillus subtilis]MEC0400801.1 ATP-dependent DNA ligase [Bacillus subtilis]